MNNIFIFNLETIILLFTVLNTYFKFSIKARRMDPGSAGGAGSPGTSLSTKEAHTRSDGQFRPASMPLPYGLWYLYWPITSYIYTEPKSLPKSIQSSLYPLSSDVVWDSFCLFMSTITVYLEFNVCGIHLGERSQRPRLGRERETSGMHAWTLVLSVVN